MTKNKMLARIKLASIFYIPKRLSTIPEITAII